MNEKEKQIQDALGLLKTYTGYVKGQGVTHFEVYEVQDVTLDGAREQLTKIITQAQKKLKVTLILDFVVDEKEETRGGWRRNAWTRPQ